MKKCLIYIFAILLCITLAGCGGNNITVDDNSNNSNNGGSDMSGKSYTVGEDIKIEFTGLRPGEKLYEEMLMEEEGLQDTSNKMIHIGKPIEMDEMRFFAQLEKLNTAAKEESPDIRDIVMEIVETYHPDVHRYVMTRERKEALALASERINDGN